MEIERMYGNRTDVLCGKRNNRILHSRSFPTANIHFSSFPFDSMNTLRFPVYLLFVLLAAPNYCHAAVTDNFLTSFEPASGIKVNVTANSTHATFTVNCTGSGGVARSVVCHWMEC
jgi:hypothetical protein